MPASCWLYVSRSQIEVAAIPSEIEQIVSTSRGRNATLDVTGALIFARGRFSQYLEGPETSVAALRASIERDDRHTDIVTLPTKPTAVRLFEGWSLAYAGEASYMSRAMERTLVDAIEGPERDVRTLINIMVGMTDGRTPKG